MDTNNENEIRFTMRMEAGLYEKLKESAQKNRRSIAKELEYLTDLHLNQGKSVEVPDSVATKLIEFLMQSKEFRKLEAELESKDN